jgi:hypothetical protein
LRLPKVEYGDVFQVSLTNGYGFIQCVKEAPKTECEIIRVLSGVYGEKDINNIDKIVGNKELFFLQLPVKYAIKQNFLKPMGKFPVPSGSVAPRFFRTEHIIGTEFVGWHIVDSETLQRRLVKKLSSEEKSLSQWDIISIPDVVEKIETGWTPEIWV